MTDGRDPSPWQSVQSGSNDEAVRKRQRGRAIVMGLLLGALVVLIFFVSIAKIKAGVK
ncbi:hypothetical protein [uncultured Sphingomonas sp.]|uniref:hypothetical protein n=1 Tax=uncultured Sphingomonas sp. TaxID=158754 RepID=UPI0035CBFE3A